MSTWLDAAAADAPVLVGDSQAMVTLRSEVAAAARTHAKVVVLGETGVGKEIVARLIHAHGPRRARTLVAVNSGGIPEALLESELFGHRRGSFTGAIRDKVGLLQQADGGTLFLDELGEMSLRMQAALLRFTETGEIQAVGAEGPTIRADVRLITATNRDLRDRIARGLFREDLYYRLGVIQIQIPPLRERDGDVGLLLQHYLLRASAAHQLPMPLLTPAADDTLRGYAWPGNVRELRNVAERLVLRNRPHHLTPDDLPAEIRRTPVPRSRRAADSCETPATADASETVTDQLWARMRDGEDFWEVVAAPFKRHDITRADLAAVIDSALVETRGSYTALLPLFNLPASDYKRLHAFLYQQQCNLNVAPYRRRHDKRMLRASSSPAASNVEEGEPVPPTYRVRRPA